MEFDSCIVKRRPLRSVAHRPFGTASR